MTKIDWFFDWLAERLRDAMQWPILFLRYLPRRSGRLLATLIDGVRGLLAFLPGLGTAVRDGRMEPWLRRQGNGLAGWSHRFVSQLFDWWGVPELAQFLMHLVIPTTPLTGDEIAAASSVLGPTAVRYGDVRVAQGGLLDVIFKYNGNRAFATWHTINLPRTGTHTRDNLPILLHELTHVYQYERVGSRYLGEAIYVQARLGGACYDYGRANGLAAACQAGDRFCDYNREQQAQIAQHYFAFRERGDDVTAYEPFIAELQEGRF